MQKKVLNVFFTGFIGSGIIYGFAAYFGLLKQINLVIISALITFFAWVLIGNITPMANYYKQQRAQFIRLSFEPRHIYAGFMVYLLIALGLLIFVLPIVHNISEALLYGFVFALVVEGVFGFASYASVNHYSAKLLLTGMIAGCMIVSGMSVLMFWLSRLF